MSGAAPADAQDEPPPDVTVLCDSDIARAVSDVARLWRRETGVPVHVIASPTPLLLKQITHPIRSDLAIAQGNPADAANAEGSVIKAATIFGGWRNRLVVARRAAQSPAPGDFSPADLATLISSDSIAFVDPPVAQTGVETQRALETAGLWDAAQKRSVGVVGTADAVYLLTHDKVGLAIVLATDVAGDPGLTTVETLPDDSYKPISYWIAQTKVSSSPNADKFEAFLRQPDAQRLLRADGLEVAS